MAKKTLIMYLACESIILKLNMKQLFLTLFMLVGLTAAGTAQPAQAGAERIWKDVARLPQTLRDELKKSSWWKNTSVSSKSAVRLDSTVKLSHFSNDKFYPINKSVFEYKSAGSTIQTDYVNFGQWALQKRTTLTRDAKNRVTEVFQEEPDPNSGTLQAGTKLSFFWHGDSDSKWDSVLSNRWDEQNQQWIHAYKLLSTFDAQNRETASETYQDVEGFRAVSIREEYQYDASGDVTMTKQYVQKDGKWKLIGQVESTFDKNHHETTRREDVTADGDKYMSIRKLKRTYDEMGRVTWEERFKNSDTAGLAEYQWSPLKTIKKGYDSYEKSNWEITESFKANGSFKNKVENFERASNDQTEREVHSTLQPETNKWRVMSETRFYYGK
jgi:hypothetical protein